MFNMLSGAVIEGAPKSTAMRSRFDGDIDEIQDVARSSREDINYHLLNGTDINSILHGLVGGVIGRAINFQSRLPDKKLNEQFESLVKIHSSSQYFSTDGSQGRDESFGSIIRFAELNGGCIIRFHYSNRRDIPLSMELVGVDKIDTGKHDSKSRLMNGIKRNRYNEITGIYLFTDPYKQKSQLFSMKNMAYYMPRWVTIDQHVAISRLVSILPKLDGMHEYVLAEVESAKKKAETGVYWMTELYDTILKAMSEFMKSKNLTDQEQANEWKKFTTQMASRGVGVQGATAVPKEDTFYQPATDSQGVFDSFSSESQKTMSSSMGLSSVSAFKDPVGSYASIKAVIAGDENYFALEFQRLNDKVIQPYLRRLFTVGVQMGLISIAKEEYFKDPSKYHKWDVLRIASRVIDENKEAISRRTNLKSGSTTLNKVYASQGLDYMTEMEKQIDLDIEVELMKKQKYANAKIERVIDEG